MLTGVTPDMAIYREETFGPIAPVIVFDDEKEVIAAANDTTYGLASYIYTRDLGRAIRVAEQLDFGIIGINDINPTSAAVPFGGVKQSGLGPRGWARRPRRVPGHSRSAGSRWEIEGLRGRPVPWAPSAPSRLLRRE